MTVISRRQYDHPVLGAAGGSGLHASIQTLYLVLGNDSQSRYVSYSAVANSATNVYAHNFGVTFAELNIAIYTGTYPNLILVADPVAAGYVIVGTAGNLKTSLDVTAPISGGPHTFNLLIQHGQPASSTMPGAVSTGAQIFAGAKTFTSTIVGSISGNAATVTTNANLTGEVTSVGNAATLLNSAVIGKVLTGYVSGAGTVAATDSILQAFQKINGNDALKAPLASPTFTGTVNLPTFTSTGDWTYAGTATTMNIKANTADGSDINRIRISSGGAASASRGANFQMFGNDFGSSVGGLFDFVAGDSTDAAGSNTAYQFNASATGGAATSVILKGTGAGAWTWGPSSSDATAHTVNGSIAQGAEIPSFSSSIFRYSGNKYSSALFTMTGGSSTGYRLWTGAYSDGTTSKRAVANQTAVRLILNTHTATSSLAVQFDTDSSISHAADSTASFAAIATATVSGDWTLGPAAQNATHIINGLTTLQRANGTSYSGVAFPPNAITTYINSTNSGTVSQVFAVRDISTVAQYMSFTTYSPANAQVDFVMQSTLSGTTKEILRATGAGAWAFGPAVTGNRTGQRHLVSGALYASNVTSTDESGIFVLGINTRIGSNTAEDGRTDTTTGGIAIRLENRTVASSQAIGFYSNQPGDTTSTAATVIGNASHAGAWMFGVNDTTASPLKVQTVSQNRKVTLIGNESANTFGISNSSTTTFRIASSSGSAAIFVIYCSALAGSALVHVGGSASVALVSNFGSVFTTSAPTAFQIQITYSTTNSEVTLTAGSSAGSGLNVFALSPAI